MTPDVSWQSLSIDAPGSPPPELDRTGAVALIPAGDRAFAAAAALTLARSLSRNGRRVLLCDLDLGAPRLHTMVGVARGAGVSDFILYGASPGYVVTELEDGFRFVSAGTPVVDHESIYTGVRWDGLLDEAIADSACLLLFVSPEAPGLGRLLDRVDSAAALGRPEELPDLGAGGSKVEVGFRPAEGDPEASATPLVSGPASASADPPDPPEDRVGASEDTRVAVGVDGSAPDEDSAPGSGGDPVRAAAAVGTGSTGGTGASGGTGARGGGRLGLWIFLVVLLVVAVVAAGWWGLIEVPGIAPRRADAREGRAESTGEAVQAAPAEAEPTAPAEGSTDVEATSAPPEAPTAARAGDEDRDAGSPAEVTAPLQRWTVRVASFRNQEVARGAAARMGAGAPDQLIVVVPVDVSGTRWFRIISALAPDRATAERLRAELATALQAPDAEEWLVRTAPLAFLVDEVADLTAARRRVSELRPRGIDGYVLETPRADGTRSYRVWAGAYAGADEARVLATLLESAGIEDATLVERRGIRPE